MQCSSMNEWCSPTFGWRWLECRAAVVGAEREGGCELRLEGGLH